MSIMRPTKAKDVRSFGKILESWELAVAAFKNAFNEKLSMNMQVAVVIGMAPAEIQDIIFQQWKGEGDEIEMEKDWKIIRDKLMALVANTVTMSTPTPMDIDRVNEDWGGIEDYEGEDGKTDAQGVEVDAVGKGDGKCRRCGGKGNFARECPTPLGKGIKKGGYGNYGSYGKGDGKSSGGGKGGSGKGIGKGYDGGPKGGKGGGKSYGYQGTCFKCGKVGHKAAECRQVAAVDEGDGETQVDSVWAMAVEVEEDAPDEKLPKKVGDNIDEQNLMIGHVAKQNWVRRGRSKVTVDSAADESVCPKAWGDVFELQEVVPGKEMKLTNANGGKIEHYGQRDVSFEVGDEDNAKVISMGFQVSDVRKPLAAVHRIVEKGNKVCFGPNVEDNFIENVKTKEKVRMRKKGRSYVLDVDFVTFQRQF